jgi:hypothetical protein
MRIKNRDSTGSHAGSHRIRPRGEYDRHAGTKDDSGRICLGEEGEILGEHVACFEVGHDEDLRPSGDGGLDALDLGGLGIDGIVERQRSRARPRLW